MFRKYYVYLFDCVICSMFYGEQTLTKKGELLCPSCLGKQRLESPFVEKIQVKNNWGYFTPEKH
jgi:hypothetical protein